MDWISVIVVTICGAFFLAVMYKALKEPIDILLLGLKNAYCYITDQVAYSAGGGGTVEVIRYE